MFSKLGQQIELTSSRHLSGAGDETLRQSRDHHASAVDIGNLQASQLCAPYPRAIERHQYHAMKPTLGGVNEVGNFFWAQYAG